MTDFRALCVELTDALDKLNCSFNVPNQSGLVERASAALAEPEPEGSTPQPADGEVAELVAWMRNQVTVHEVAQTQWAKRFVRAASLLERLSPPQPVPVSERLPGAEDCDAGGRCWWGAPALPSPVPASWCFVSAKDRFGSELYWLPANALPQPS